MPRSAIPPTARRAGCSADKAFREGFAVLGRLGLSFDAWLYHPQIGELADLARAFPATRIVLNHVGGPIGIGTYAEKRKEVFAAWAAAIEGASPHARTVCVKLGGLGMRMGGFGFHEQPEPPSSEALAAAWQPYVETCIAAFGASRCMFESNFPVDKGSYSYPVFWNACKLLAKGASKTEKADLFAGTAARFYRSSTCPADATSLSSIGRGRGMRTVLRSGCCGLRKLLRAGGDPHPTSCGHRLPVRKRAILKRSSASDSSPSLWGLFATWFWQPFGVSAGASGLGWGHDFDGLDWMV
jgi:hypothetical protein